MERQISADTIRSMAAAIARNQSRITTLEAKLTIILIFQGLIFVSIIAILGWLVTNG